MDGPRIPLLRFYGMDMDSDPRNVGGGPAKDSPTGSYISARNVHVGGWIAQAGGLPNYMKGTVEVQWPMPAGNNKCVGTHYDPVVDSKGQAVAGKTGRLIWFNWNSNGDHCICQLNNDTGLGEILLQSSILNLAQDRYVTSINIVDNRYLQWTDYSNRPREIDIPHADLNGKNVEIDLYLDSSDVLVDSRSFSASISDGTSTVSTILNFWTATQAQVDDVHNMYRGFVAAWNTNFGQYFTAEYCDGLIELTAVTSGPDWDIVVNWQDTIAAVLQPIASAHNEYSNRYNRIWTEEQIARAKIAPALAPEIQLVEDHDRQSNFVERQVIQVAYLYRFRDRSRSTISPFSLITNSGSCGSVNFNAVSITFNDPWLDETSAMRGEISYIELLVRYGNTLPWRSVEVIPKERWIYRRPYKFLNDGLYPAIDEQFAELLYSNVPVIAQSQEVIQDYENNHRAIFGGTVEGYPNPCLDFSVDVDYEESGIKSSGGSKILGKVVVKAPLMRMSAGLEYINNQPIHRLDPNGPNLYGGIGIPGTGFLEEYQRNPSLEDLGQTMGESGFILYLEGTDKIAISRQSTPAIPGTLTLVPGTTVYDTSQHGNPAFSNPTQKTHRAAVRQAIQTTGIWSEFEFSGLQPGQTYVLRMADPRCSYGNAVPELDLNNPSRLYQKTSFPVLGVGTLASGDVVPGTYECRVTIPAAGGTVDVGFVFVADNSYPTDGFLTVVKPVIHMGYLTDSDAQDNGAIDIREGTPMERQSVIIKGYVAGAPFANPNIAAASYLAANGLQVAEDVINEGYCPTDHNGFWWYATIIAGPADLRNFRIGATGVTGDVSNPIGVYTGFSAGNFTVNNLQIINQFNQSKWAGDWGGGLTGPSTANLGNTPGLYRWFMPNLNQDVHDITRTTVTGIITIAGGSPLSNVLVILEDGSSDRTDSQGQFSIPTYGDMYRSDVININNNDRLTNIIINWDSACVLTISGGNIHAVNITQFEENQEWSNLISYEVNLSGSVLAGGGYGRKRGATKRFAIALKDQYGVISRLQATDTIRIAHLTEDLNKYRRLLYPTPDTFKYGPPIVSWQINGPVPVPEHGYYTHAQLYETQDLAYRWYLQWAVGSAIYVSQFNEDTGEPSVTLFNSGSDREIWLDIGASFLQYRQENSDTAYLDDLGDLEQQFQVGYTFTPGDRLRIFTTDGGAFLTDYIDVPIKGQRGDFIVIAVDGRLPEMKGGEMIEIMTPRPEVDYQPFYEVPGACFPINNPSTNPSWSVNSGILPGGDTFYISTGIPTRPGNVPVGDPLPPQLPWRNQLITRESSSVSDFYKSDSWNQGRINWIDTGADQEYRPTLVRYSDPYYPQTTEKGEATINGMNMFYPLDIREANRDFGLIMRMVYINSHVLCICSNQTTFSIYVGIEETDSNGTMTVVNQVLAQIRPLQQPYGTQHPESVVIDRNMVKWVDMNSGVAVRYSAGGLVAISDKFRVGSFFRDKCQNLKTFPNPVVIGGLDPKHDEYLVTFRQAQKSIPGNPDPIDVEEPQETTYFYEKENVWGSMIDWFPEAWANTDLDCYSFRAGRFYKMNEGPYGEFGGVKFPFSLTVAAQSNPDTDKSWLAIQITATAGGWSVPYITNENGQQSNLIESDFTKEGTMYSAAFLCDELTPNVQYPLMQGDNLTSRWIIARVEYNGPDPCNAESIIIYYSRYESTYP